MIDCMTTAGAASLGTCVPTMEMLKYTDIKPYLLTIDRTVPAIDYAYMKSKGVVGVAIESGYLYDASHVKHSYRNPNLESQVHAAATADIPYALYTVSRAWTVAEANQEIEQLQTCIQKYNPQLGVWVQIAFASNPTINDKIIDRYQGQLERLGMKNKIGIYATMEQLKRISWSRHCSSWNLWLVEHVDDIGDIEQVLAPEFFMTGYSVG